MGTYYGWHSKEALVEYLKTDFSDHVKAIRHSLRGNHFWTLVENKNTGERIIRLDVITCYKGEWGYKPLDETMGPFYYDCPIGMIEQTTPTDNKYANKWRQRVIDCHAKKRERTKIKYKEGQTWNLYGKEYVLTRKAGPRKGWNGYLKGSSVRYRIPFIHLSKATLVE
jgi:hypothetical protein